MELNSANNSLVFGRFLYCFTELSDVNTDFQAETEVTNISSANEIVTKK
jgi:hypothetical protein